jgi:hypothetical protein
MIALPLVEMRMQYISVVREIWILVVTWAEVEECER